MKNERKFLFAFVINVECIGKFVKCNKKEEESFQMQEHTLCKEFFAVKIYIDRSKIKML